MVHPTIDDEPCRSQAYRFSAISPVIEKLDAVLLEGLPIRYAHGLKWLAAFVLDIADGRQRQACLA